MIHNLKVSKMNTASYVDMYIYSISLLYDLSITYWPFFCLALFEFLFEFPMCVHFLNSLYNVDYNVLKNVQ